MRQKRKKTTGVSQWAKAEQEVRERGNRARIQESTLLQTGGFAMKRGSYLWGADLEFEAGTTRSDQIDYNVAEPDQVSPVFTSSWQVPHREVLSFVTIA